MRYGWVLALFILTLSGCHDRDDEAAPRRERTDSYGQTIEIRESGEGQLGHDDKKHDDDDDDDDDD